MPCSRRRTCLLLPQKLDPKMALLSNVLLMPASYPPCPPACLNGLPVLWNDDWPVAHFLHYVLLLLAAGLAVWRLPRQSACLAGWRRPDPQACYRRFWGEGRRERRAYFFSNYKQQRPAACCTVYLYLGHWPPLPCLCQKNISRQINWAQIVFWNFVLRGRTCS
jgi:hypothetical protein